MLTALGLMLMVKPTIYFGFFMKGSGPRPAEPAVLQQMQTDHIDNLKRLHGEGALLAAGPLADPTQQRRGVLVLQATNREQIPSFFANDPYVKAGIMTVAIEEWKVDAAKFNSHPVDPDSVVEYRLVLAPYSLEAKATRNALIAHSTQVVGGVGETRSVFLVNGATPDFKAAMARINPQIEVIPLWMTGGILR
jgi:uncharacterized protein YciI